MSRTSKAKVLEGTTVPSNRK
ncbi:hypothetical protein AVEN_49955-1, partial [Araneus ventricosus]